MKTYITCITSNWDEEDQKDKYIYYEDGVSEFVTIYDAPSNHKKSSIYDMTKKNQLLTKEVVLADGLQAFKFVTDDGSTIWHIIYAHLGTDLKLFSYSGDCKSQNNSNSDSEFEQIE